MEPPLDSFHDVESHLRLRWTARHLGPFAVEIAEIGSARVRAEMLRARGESWLAVSAYVAAELDVNAVGALLYNATLPVGFLAIDEGALWLRTVMRLHGIVPGTLDELIDYLVGEVAHIVQRRGERAELAALFDNLAE